jgi:hypothetical protein
MVLVQRLVFMVMAYVPTALLPRTAFSALSIISLAVRAIRLSPAGSRRAIIHTAAAFLKFIISSLYYIFMR